MTFKFNVARLFGFYKRGAIKEHYKMTPPCANIDKHYKMTLQKKPKKYLFSLSYTSAYDLLSVIYGRIRRSFSIFSWAPARQTLFWSWAKDDQMSPLW